MTCPNLGTESHANIYGIEGIPQVLKVDKKMFFGCKCGAQWESDDPFREINEYLFQTVDMLNRESGVRFHPLPMIHPLKPNVHKDVQGYHTRHHIKGIKIHSLVDRTSPRTYIESELSYNLKRLGLRVLFHTDVDDVAHPSAAIDFAERTGVYCQLAHGCRGDVQSLRRVSKLPNVIVDLSPLNLIYEKGRLLGREFSSYEDFIGYSIENATENKVVAASDYFWCGWTEESFIRHWKVFDGYDSQKLLYENARDFWEL